MKKHGVLVFHSLISVYNHDLTSLQFDFGFQCYGHWIFNPLKTHTNSPGTKPMAPSLHTTPKGGKKHSARIVLCNLFRKHCWDWFPASCRRNPWLLATEAQLGSIAEAQKQQTQLETSLGDGANEA